MENNIIDEIRSDFAGEKSETEEKIKEENENLKDEQIRELKVDEFQEMIDPIKSAFDEEAKKDEFFRNDNLNSLVLVNENKNAMIENLRKTWNEQHFRVQDFKQKKLLKYPQIFYFTMGFLYNSEMNTFDQKTSTLTKYTFNLDDNSEIDVGGSINSRNSVGQGSLFCGYRFSLMNDRLFNYISYTGGDNRKIFYEMNYMPNDDTLLDYIYKRKLDDDYIPIFDSIGQEEEDPEAPPTIKNKNHPNFVNFKHYFTIHKMLYSKSNRISFGVIKNNKNYFLSIAQKHILYKENSVRTSLKFSSESLMLNNKIKHKISDSFYCESEQKLDYSGYGMNIFNNRIFYKKNSNIFSFGVFNSFDGSGLELGFRFGGVNLKLPIFIWKSDLDLDELTEKRFFASLLEFTFIGIATAGVSYLCKFIISKFVKFKKYKMKTIVNETILKEKREKLKQLKSDHLKALEILNKSADKYHQLELEKKEKGLIIHLALYGKFEHLERYKKDFDYLANKIKYAKGKNIDTTTDEFNISMKIKEFKLDEICDNVENEILDVTMPVRNKISSNSQNLYSSVFFREATKTSVFGFYNPIFKSEEIPYILMM